MKQKDGKYLIMKDPNKPMIRLYDIPDKPSSQTMKMPMMKRQVSEYDEHLHDHILCGDL
jgi:hypothetical protein